MLLTPRQKTITHAHLFCGLGGAAIGFNRGHARVGNVEAQFECLGGIDVSAAAVEDFTRLVGVAGTTLDLFSEQQYTAFHGRPPPPGWREATPADIHAAFQHRTPNLCVLSPPCKAFSGLLSETASRSAKYQALNELTVRGVWLMLEAYADDLPEMVLLENVPRIASRGRHLLDTIIALLQSYGYSCNESTHDCGELGGLPQHRNRYLLVGRLRAKVPPFLYEPYKQRVRGVGELLSRMPLPGAPEAGPMHRIPALQFQTWTRLAFVEAGKDWRSLNRLAVEGGVLRDYALLREEAHSLVPDPRAASSWDGAGYLGVREFGQPSGAVIGNSRPGAGAFSVADPRVGQTSPRFNNVYRVIPYNQPSPVVTGQGGNSAALVADPRAGVQQITSGKYRITGMDEASGTVIGASTTGQGAFAVADPRPVGLNRDTRTAYRTNGAYGVVPYERASGAVPGFGKHDNGAWSVADPRLAAAAAAYSDLPTATDRGVCVIIAEDQTWHRPLTTLELAGLMGLYDPDTPLIELHGRSESAWRERIGNSIPPPAATAVASVMAKTLLLAWSGHTMALSDTPIWVAPLAAGLSMEAPNYAAM